MVSTIFFQPSTKNGFAKILQFRVVQLVLPLLVLAASAVQGDLSLEYIGFFPKMVDPQVTKINWMIWGPPFWELSRMDGKSRNNGASSHLVRS